MEKPVALIGLPASGKTSVGRRLAGLMGLPFVDLDEAVEAAAGMSVPEVFARLGEARFRELESAALAAASGGGTAVVATGGGCVLSAANRAALASGFRTVWLDLSPETAAARSAGGSRPLLDGRDALAAMRALSEARRGFYAECASLTVDAGSRSVDELAEVIHEQMR